MKTDPFQVASVSLANVNERVSELAHPFLQLLPVSGASVSTFGPLLGAETISATDARAERVDELQFDLGEGPCWDALSERRPILQPDFARTANVWPAFANAIRPEQISALFAFPLVFGPLDIGAIDLYSLDPISLTDEQQAQALALSAIVSRIVLRHAVDHVDSVEITSPFSRRLIHQATGMVLAQLNIKADDAYLLLQARAFSDNRSMQEVADDIVNRRLRLADDTEPG